MIKEYAPSDNAGSYLLDLNMPKEIEIEVEIKQGPQMTGMELDKELSQYKAAMEKLYCAINGYESYSGWVSNISDQSYKELYTDILNGIKKLKENASNRIY